MAHEKTLVHYWRYEDGWRTVPYFLREDKKAGREFDEGLKGWHCWVYPRDDLEFEQWMDQNMKGKYDYTHRFNSGDPMYTVNIKSDEDATLFKLRWM
jgi:hypothetical protein